MSIEYKELLGEKCVSFIFMVWKDPVNVFLKKAFIMKKPMLCTG